MKDLILSTQSTSKLKKRLENETNKIEQRFQKVKENCDKIPIVQEWRDVINEEKKITNEIKKMEDLKNDLILNLKRKQNDVAELDRQRIIEFSKFMLEERPKLLGNIKERQIERDNLKKQIFEKQKQNSLGRKICKVEKGPLLSSQKIKSAATSSSSRDLSAMWRVCYVSLNLINYYFLIP